jgi:response regulator of citrate/malate metabolism
VAARIPTRRAQAKLAGPTGAAPDTPEVVIISVLIVEDERAAATALLDYVQRTPGFAVAGHARTGAEALRRLAVDHVDLVLLDIYLPDMSGLEVLRRARAAGWTVDVIAVTVARDLAVLQASLSLGVVQYLLKPFTFATVWQKLERYSSYRTALTEQEIVVAQQEIDSILNTLRDDRGALPKGVIRESLHAVVAALKQMEGEKGLSAVEAARVLGASRITARRYLEYLVRSGLVSRYPRYGSAGRPEVEYRLISGRHHGASPAGREH